MATRGCIAVGTPDKWRGVYNHWDSYPTHLGVLLADRIRKKIKQGETLKQICDDILNYDDWRNYLNGGVCPYCGRKASQPHSILSILWLLVDMPEKREQILMTPNKDLEPYEVEIKNNLRKTGYPDPEIRYHQHETMDIKKLKNLQITSENVDPLEIEWVYILNPNKERMYVLYSVEVTPQQWKYALVGNFSLDEILKDEVDWDALEQIASMLQEENK
jgi:hypothetical protein